jgi:two-component system, chemotaxis family, CheB/CheR fusion protein
LDGEAAGKVAGLARIVLFGASASTGGTPEDVVAADENEKKDFIVVGIGASAGGLEALERLFSHLPADTGMAFVILQHLSPDFRSLMDELLSRRTAMAVKLAAHEMVVEPNCVYLLPPQKEMIIRDRRLLLSDKDPRHGLALPIDLFFRSLAHDVGERAVAVVLSGSGSDGSRGVLEVSRAGGVVISESPDTAQFNSMPLSAIRTGVVDQVLAPEEIADALAALGRAIPYTADEVIEDRGVEAILRLLRDEYGIDFSHYKASTVSRRIERRLALARAIDIEAYIEQLRSDPRELNSLYEDLLIGVTRFFRDEQAFSALEERIIPEILDRTKSDEQIRVWTPGCATGEEAYSIAILLYEALNARKRPVNVKILATDVHKASLEHASSGVYTEQQIAGISPERRERFFTVKPNGFHVSQSIRECIVFAPHNLIRDAPFTRLDLIVCRNLLIYFQAHAQKTVLTLFHFALKPGGILFLGSSESPGGLLDEFVTIDEHAKMYRKQRDIALPRDLRLPLPRGGGAHRLPPAAAPRTNVSPKLIAQYDRLLDKFMPPGFLVDQDGVLVDSFGGVESMLKVKGRRPVTHLVEMLSDELRVVVAGALHRVKRDGTVARYVGVPCPERGGRCTLTAEPLNDPHGVVNHILLTFVDEVREDTFAPPPRETAADGGAAMLDVQQLSVDQLNALQDELSYTRENLQAAIQELETANEELQATNEELIASNEELQSTNEELHSVNEELYTVNAEYQKKNVELQELNDDIEHLLNGTDVGTMFLDRQLCIRKFTPRIAGIFRVINQDIGRPIRTFSHDLVYPTLLADIERVLREGVTVERETWDFGGRCYFLRILPYRARQRGQEQPADPETLQRLLTPDGVVLTLTDISPLDQARSKLAQLSAIVESSDDAIVGHTKAGIVTSWNRGAARLFGYAAEEAIGRHINFVFADDARHDVDKILAEVCGGDHVERVEMALRRKDGVSIDASVKFSPIRDGANAIVGVSAIARDITPIVRARQEVAEREERIRLLLDSTAEAIYGVDLSGACTFCNAACAELLGYDSPAALIGKQMHPLIHHTRADGTPYPPEQSPIYEAMRRREGAHVDDEVLWRADGTSFPAEYWSHPIYRNDEVIGAVVTFLDVSERRRAEEEVQEGVRRREQFLAMLSHELRNPLAAILSATRILAATALPDNSCQEAGQVVERQAKHMARLLDDLLDVSRITHGRIVLRKELIDLRETTHSAIEALGPFMAEHGTKLTVSIDDEPLFVHGDPARLQQIQANLLSNASKYSVPDGRVHLELRRDGRNALIRVADHGRGIEPEMLPRIFDLFVQGEQSIARPEGGLGIGLTLLRSLVELHDGRVEARSEGAGKGCEFTVWLPLVEEGAMNQSEPAAPARAAVKTVVIVEDQADARRMLQLLLETQGLMVFAAENGAEGAALIEQLRPDLALVDLGLPIMSGFDLARRIRGNPDNAHTRLVALSGYGQDSDIDAALQAGFDDHLTKPPDPARLDEVLAGIEEPEPPREAGGSARIGRPK